MNIYSTLIHMRTIIWHIICNAVCVCVCLRLSRGWCGATFTRDNNVVGYDPLVPDDMLVVVLDAQCRIIFQPIWTVIV